MKKIRRRLPSPAILVAVVALVAAITGTAVAGPDAITSISKKKTKKIANTQAKKQINKSTPWGTEDIADGAISSSKLQDGSVSSSKLSSESVKSDELGEITTETDSTTVAAQSSGSASVSCDSDQKVVSGGWEGPPFNQNGPAFLVHEDQRSNNGWTASVTNLGNQPGQLTVYAYCLEESE